MVNFNTVKLNLEADLIVEGWSDEAWEELVAKLKKAVKKSKKKLKDIDDELLDWFGTVEPELGQ